jgi:tight adherence protein C
VDVTFLAAGAVFLTVFVLFLAVSGGEASVRDRLRTLWTPMEQAERPKRLTVRQRLLGPLVDLVVQLVRRLLPTRMLDQVQRQLIVAGEPMTFNAFLTLQALMTVGFIVLPLLLIISGAVDKGLMAILMVVGGGVAGFMLPQMWLRSRAAARSGKIIRTLPDSFDLITTCVEAGLGLDAALARVAEKVEGPFAEELRRTLREISLGKLRRDAMRELGQRTDVPDLVTFVNAVIQAEEMGSSIGNVLRVQSEQLRIRRRQRAEEQAYKAPVKMIFPLVLCIFPTLFLVILGPAVITIMHDFPSQ